MPGAPRRSRSKPQPPRHGGYFTADLPLLHADGAFFVLADGTPWTAIETAEFSLFLRYLRKEDVRPILDDRLAIGFNLLRIWLLNTSVLAAVDGRGLHPDWFPGFYDELAAFRALLVHAGARAEFTAFTQTPLLMPTRDAQQRHLDQVGAALAGSPHLLEQVNEYDHTTNGVRDNACAPDLTPPRGILFASGSMTADVWPVLPARDYITFHPGGDPSGVALWARKVGHNSMEVADAYHVPVVANETIRYPDSEQSLAHAEDAAASAALLCAGACFHSWEGKLSQVFGPSRAAAEAWVRGARSVPLEFQRGVYHRRDDLLTPSFVRVYDRTLPDGRSHIVAIRV